jgi:hypothetical protein
MAGWRPRFENPATTQGAGMGLAIAPEFGDHDVIGHRSTIKHFSARVPPEELLRLIETLPPTDAKGVKPGY